LVGRRPFALAVDDAVRTALRWVDVEAGIVLDDPGVEAVPGSSELPATPPVGARLLPETAEKVVGTAPGFAGCAEVQPEAAANSAVAAQRIPPAHRRRGRGDRILAFTIIFGWPSTLPS
jgi:hypothetical protein